MKTVNVNYIFESLSIAALTALFSGFVLSRGLYSVGLLLMGIYCLCQWHSFMKALKNNWFLLSLIVPLLALLKDGFSNVFFINLILPLFVAFSFCFHHHSKIKWASHFILFAIFFVTACCSVYHYFSNVDATILSYKQARVMPLGYFNDHVRTSTAFALSCMLALYYLMHDCKKWLRILAGSYLFFQIIFLHLLAARTGLICLYLCFAIFILTELINKRNIKILIAFIPFFILPIVSYKLFPSFYHRVGFTFYDFNYYKKMEYRKGSSDGVRYYSVLAGIDIFKENYLFGSGFSGVKEKSIAWFDSKFPKMMPDEKMQPHSQYIIYLAATGILGLLGLLMFLIYPLLYSKIYSSSYNIAIYISLLFICIIDVFLDHQLKIFVLCYFLSESVFGFNTQSNRELRDN